MDIQLSNELKQFRNQVQSFLSLSLTPEIIRASDLTTSVYTDYDTAMAWQHILFKQGWVAPNWPEQYGGTGWSTLQRMIFAWECANAGAPMLSPMGLLMLAPALFGYGSDWQKKFYLPRILSGEDYWCQGFSEPQAGSDLANLSTRAILQDDYYIVTGTKIWTTHAQYANRMFCLVRTSETVKPQSGITFLLINMNTPGVTVKPIYGITGEHVQNQVFLDQVKVPIKDRVGEQGDGWSVTKYLFQFERGGILWAPLLTNAMRKLYSLIPNDEGRVSAIFDNNFRYRLAKVEIKLLAYSKLEQQHLLSIDNELIEDHCDAPMLKILSSELKQDISELTYLALSEFAVPWQHPTLKPSYIISDDCRYQTSAPKYLNARAASIYAGTNEIQRNIVAKQVLGF